MSDHSLTAIRIKGTLCTYQRDIRQPGRASIDSLVAQSHKEDNMSRQYNEWFFRNRPDRDWFDDAWDEHQEHLATLPGIHKWLYEICTPFAPCRIKRSLHALGFPLDSADPFSFMPKRSTPLRRAEQAAKRASKAAQRERNTHDLTRLMDACKPFPATETE